MREPSTGGKEMGRKTRTGRIAVAAALMLLASACGGKSALRNPPGSSAVGNTIPVTIHNNSNFTVDVYATSGGSTTQMIGTVSSGQVGTLQLDMSTIATGPIQLIAVPLGGRGLARSGPLVLTSGDDSIRFNIQPNLSASVATVH
jgi:hypothetical protein